MVEVKNQSMSIGAKPLTNEQARMILPTYDRIAEQIEEFRLSAAAFKERSKDTILRADNTISILGDRGSGKTSIMLTYYERHKKDHPVDLVLDLIEPEHMSETTDSLGWIMGAFLEEVNRLESEYAQLSPATSGIDQTLFKQCLRKESTPLRDSYTNLMQSYVFRKELYLKSVIRNNEGQMDMLRENELISYSDRGFSNRFNHFVDDLIEFNKKLSSVKYQDNSLKYANKEPLLLFFFDDVDVSADRCPEILSNILTYLSHPNVVVLVSGDYKVFAEAMTMRFLVREVPERYYHTDFMTNEWSRNRQADKKQEQENAIEIRKKRSQDYLKKVLPPAYRFELTRFTDHGKGIFNPEHLSPENTLLKLLGEIQFSGSETLKEQMGDGLKAYLVLFDAYPRGLINPYYFMHKKSHSSNPTWDALDVVDFLKLLLHSSAHLNGYMNDITETLSLAFTYTDEQVKFDFDRTYIDYTPLREVYDSIFEIRDMKIDTDVVRRSVKENLLHWVLYVDFAESLVRLAEPEFKALHKDKCILSKVLNSFEGDNDLFPKVEDSRIVLNLFAHVFEVFSFSSIAQLYTHSFMDEKFYTSLSKCSFVQTESEICPNKKLIDLFETMYDLDREWVSAHVDYLMDKGSTLNEFLQKNKKSVNKRMRKKKLVSILEKPECEMEGVELSIIQVEAKCRGLLEYIRTEVTKPSALLKDVEKGIRKHYRSRKLEQLEREIQQFKSVKCFFESGQTIDDNSNNRVIELEALRNLLENQKSYINHVRSAWEHNKHHFVINTDDEDLEEYGALIASYEPGDGMPDIIAKEDCERIQIMFDEVFLYKKSDTEIEKPLQNAIMEYFWAEQEIRVLEDYFNILEQEALDNLESLVVMRDKYIVSIKEFDESDSLAEENAIMAIVPFWRIELSEDLKKVSETFSRQDDIEFWRGMHRSLRNFFDQGLGSENEKIQKVPVKIPKRADSVVERMDEDEYLNYIREQGLLYNLHQLAALYAHVKTIVDYRTSEGGTEYFRDLKQAFRNYCVTSKLRKSNFQRYVEGLLKG